MGDAMQDGQTYDLIGCCMEVHSQLGAGFLEPVYQEALSIELEQRGIPFVREKELTIGYKGHLLQKRYYADFICYDSVILELKALSALLPDHQAQVLNYLKVTGLHVGLLINFGAKSLQWKRVVL